jgi:YHS domain-containing protein
MITLLEMTLSLDNGRVSFGDHDEIELATATDPVCACELRRADAAGAVDYHGQVYFFCSTTCRDAFLLDPARYAAAAPASAER